MKLWMFSSTSSKAVFLPFYHITFNIFFTAMQLPYDLFLFFYSLIAPKHKCRIIVMLPIICHYLSWHILYVQYRYDV